ncbi:hypothetical protein WISP_98268 [Willisornis vidua]|uniref:Uncharacterized protein n=1 Tax=Willisornis vidua TaxID=1566151 RepID=A0ABQ9CZA0_9PASS|nr:hypothetical protein WISP_98268 [Willisornis vidua]
MALPQAPAPFYGLQTGPAAPKSSPKPPDPPVLHRSTCSGPELGQQAVLEHHTSLTAKPDPQPTHPSAPPNFLLFATMETPCETNLPFEQIKGVASLNSPKFLNSKCCSNAVMLAL